ncbi:MAG: metallophosphoesterase [Anaerolineae bacterium]|nr:metallophosphoesterase [Anaerolineae bacterium]
MRIAWSTDLHLNFLGQPQILNFLAEVSLQKPDVWLISGDIGDAPRLLAYLRLFDMILRFPVYFVLGNHDFYHGSLGAIREVVSVYCGESRRLRYLPETGIVALSAETAVVGVDGWGDGRIGDYQNSWVMLNDFLLIHELTGLSEAARLAHLNALGDVEAARLRDLLPQALATHRRVIVVTHVPPFKETCWHEGQLSDDNFLPFFTCQAVGDVLLEVMADQPADRECLVLCGHSHGAGEVQVRENLRVLTGGAEYEQPTVQRVFEF